MKIRVPNLEDVLPIINLFKDLDRKHIASRQDFRESIKEKRYTSLIKEAIENEEYSIFIASVDKQIIGFSIGKIKSIRNHPFLEDTNIGEIQYVAIAESYKRLGVAKSLLDSVETELRSKGANSLEMRVYSFNDEAYPTKVNYFPKYTVYEKF